MGLEVNPISNHNNNCGSYKRMDGVRRSVGAMGGLLLLPLFAVLMMG